jgi:response regulator RpfG family c-di-GMP phosphodiesterase
MFADTIDAMTTDRPYRKALGEAEVRAELIKWRGTQFDPTICDALMNSPNFARIFDKNDSGGVYSLTQIFDAIRKKRTRTPAVA